MNEELDNKLMNAVVQGTLKDVKRTFKKNIRFDDSYFDYKLLQAAFKRSDVEIINYLLNKTECRVNNPKKARAEETLLHLAVKLNNRYIIKKLLSKEVSIFDKDENGEIPLLAAFKHKKLVAVQALLTHFQPNCKPDDKDAMLYFHIACATNHVSAAEHFLKCGVNPNSPFSLESEEYSGLNPVHFAAQKNYYPLFQLLVQQGGDLSKKNAKGLTPLHIIYYTCSINTTKCRIKQIFGSGSHTKLTNVEDDNRFSHFHLCCMLNDPNLIQVFIDNGADVNSTTSSDCTINPGFTPLHFAVINHCDKVVELLLKSGADCNKADKDGKIPLHWVCSLFDKREKIADMLLNHKSCPATVDNQGSIPLHIEFCNTRSKNKYIFNRLSKIAPTDNLINNEGLSLFHIACAAGDIKRVKDFLDSGVKVNSCVSSGDYSGYTALHFAVLNNQEKVVELLLKKKAAINSKTKEFQVSPLHLACEFNYAKFHRRNLGQNLGNRTVSEPFPVDLDSISNRTNQLDIISLLLSHGAHVNAKDYQGITPLLHTCMIDQNYCKLSWTCLSCASKVKSGVNREVLIRLKEMVEMLCANKAQMNILSNRQESILHIMSKYEFVNLKSTKDLIKFILSKDIDVDSVDNAGLTPLHVAVEANNSEMVKILLENKANVNIKNKDSEIPLHGLFWKEVSFSGFDWNLLKPVTDIEKREEIFLTLLENGSDVNILIGEECKFLLHAAIHNRDNLLIKELLCHGANINMEDSLGNSCVYSLLKWGEADNNCILQFEFAEAFQIIYIHVQKLLALGIHVSDKVQKICHELYACHETVLRYSMIINDPEMNLIELKNIALDCTKELEKLKTRKIDNYTSLYSILLKDEHELSKHFRKENFSEIIDEKIKNDFPLYHDSLALQFRRGSKRNALLPTAKEVLTSLIHIFNINLPDLCCDMIVKYLKNEDLANLKAATPPKRSLKRKLNRIQSEEDNRRVKTAKRPCNEVK